MSQDFDRFAKVSLNSAKPSDFYGIVLRDRRIDASDWIRELISRAIGASRPIDVLGIFIHVVCNALFFYNRRPTAVQASLAVVFFIRNTVYREDYRLNTLNDRSLWESREASVIQSPVTATIRHAPCPFETYCSVCSWRIHCFDTHRSPLSFLPFREYPRDSSARSSEDLKRAWRRHVRHFTEHLTIPL